jgi:O-antigen/teichoic acid export membrane protein
MQPLSLKKLVTNFSFLAGGEVLSKLFTFAAFAFLARVLGPASFGQLEFTLAVIILFTLLVDFGTSPYGAREIAKNKDLVGELLGHISILRVLLAITGYALLVIFILIFVDHESPVRPLLLIYGLTLFAVPGFLQWVFQGLDKMKWVGAGSAIRQLIFASGVFLCIRSADQLLSVAVIECLAVSGFVLYCIALYVSRIRKFEPHIDPYKLKHSFEQALPIGLSQLAWASTWYFPTILLSLLVGGEVVGWFSAAHRPVMTLHTFIWLYFYNIFPSMSRFAGEGEETLQNLMTNSLKITAWAAIFLGMLGTLLAQPTILLIFGHQYAETISTFRILIWLLPIALLSGNYRYALIAANHQRYEFFSQACGALTAVGFGFVLVPNFSAHGAAFSLLLAAIINWTMAYIFVRTKIGHVPFTAHLLRPVAASALMLVGFQLLQPFNIWFASCISIAIYISTSFLLQPELRKLII